MEEKEDSSLDKTLEKFIELGLIEAIEMKEGNRGFKSNIQRIKN